MTAKIIISPKIWQKVKDHLFSETSQEQAGFAICGISRGINHVSILVREFVPLKSPDFLYCARFGIQIKPQKVIEMVNKSYPHGDCLLEIHSHPWNGGAFFSEIDFKGATDMANYLFPQFPEIPYAALVVTFDSHSVNVFFGKSKIPALVKILPDLSTMYSKKKTGKRIGDMNRQFDRQIRFFGRDTQKEIARVKVGIVGVGGTGSHVAQQLAYLGVRQFVLVDHDIVENSNLNRLVGVTKSDIGKNKTAVVGNYIKTINNSASIKQIFHPVYAKESINELKDVDFIFGCTDNDGARLIINSIATSYLIPYIDIGTDINLLPNGDIASAGGKVFCIFPDGPCMFCPTNEIDINEVRDNVSSKEDRKERERKGYAKGKIKSPSIVSVNGMVASLAVTEFIYYLMSVKRSIKIIYDIHGMLYFSPQIAKNQGCIHCVGNFAIGDKAGIENYVNKLER